MQKVKNTIPVYDICSLADAGQQHQSIIAAPFAQYLESHPNLHRAHGHSFYHLVLFTRGSGFHTIDFKRIPVVVGQIYFMIPGQVHSWSFEGEMDGFVVNFPDHLFRNFPGEERLPDRFSFLSGNAMDGVVQLPEAALQKVAGIMQEIVNEVTNVQAYSLDMARLLLLSLFITVARVTAGNENERTIAKPNQVLNEFLKLVNEHFAKHTLPKDFARRLNITPNHLNAICKELMNKPAGTIIRDRILLEAKRLLVNADAGIADIGYQLGFADNSYFTKFFKKYAGTTPDAFRKTIAAGNG